VGRAAAKDFLLRACFLPLEKDCHGSSASGIDFDNGVETLTAEEILIETRHGRMRVAWNGELTVTDQSSVALI
jgi:hypothetical protein